MGKTRERGAGYREKGGPHFRWVTFLLFTGHQLIPLACLVAMPREHIYEK